jgi:hypothetical protein
MVFLDKRENFYVHHISLPASVSQKLILPVVVGGPWLLTNVTAALQLPLYNKEKMEQPKLSKYLNYGLT